MKLTFGMATYEDPQGVYYTLQSFRLHHERPQDTELLVVDNAKVPNGATQKICRSVGARYLHAPRATGTSAPRDLVFREGKGEVVVCVDCHVLLAPHAVDAILCHFDERTTPDLVQGPMLYDSFNGHATHFDPVWRKKMWGTWARAWKSPSGEIFACRETSDRQVAYVDTFGNDTKVDALNCHLFPADLGWAGHEQRLARMGHTAPEKFFNIKMQGLGLFAMRKTDWPGFNPNFRGFGGEEGYIHEKVRQRGGLTVCVPSAKWVHRFRYNKGDTPSAADEKIPYLATIEDRVRNYLLGHLELGLDAAPIIRHFADGLSADKLKNIIKDVYRVHRAGLAGHSGREADRPGQETARDGENAVVSA